MTVFTLPNKLKWRTLFSPLEQIKSDSQYDIKWASCCTEYPIGNLKYPL